MSPHSRRRVWALIPQPSRSLARSRRCLPSVRWNHEENPLSTFALPPRPRDRRPDYEVDCTDFTAPSIHWILLLMIKDRSSFPPSAQPSPRPPWKDQVSNCSRRWNKFSSSSSVFILTDSTGRENYLPTLFKHSAPERSRLSEVPKCPFEWKAIN